MPLRQPIITLLGHIDHGKTTLLDQIRGSAIQKKEEGGITQEIGATSIPLASVKGICGGLIEQLQTEIELPGVLFIDTPGHAAFTNLRVRGGSITDLAILVIDVTEGVMPQTKESIKILKRFESPFLIAANKIDLISGWIDHDTVSFIESYNEQRGRVRSKLDEKIYELMGELAELGFDTDRYDEIKDYRKKVPIIPTSAKTGEGIAELLMVLIGLAQRYQKDKLEVDIDQPAKGTILEVKEEKGLGKTMDSIVYQGKLRKGDTILVPSGSDILVRKVKALLEPEEKQEIRAKPEFRRIDEAVAATGIKIAAPDLEGVTAGMPIEAIWKESEIEDRKAELKKKLKDMRIETEKEGVVLKANSLGTLEALAGFLKERDIEIKRAEIGKVTKLDVNEANAEEEFYNGVIMAFRVKVPDRVKKLAEEKDVKLISSGIIYTILRDYEDWKKTIRQRRIQEKLEKLPSPAKIKVLPDHIFRQSKPAILGVEVLSGIAGTGTRLINEDGRSIGKIKSLEKQGEKIDDAERNQRVAAAISGAVAGRNVYENDVLFSDIQEEEFKKLKELKKFLDEDQLVCLKEVKSIKRQEDPLWGI